MLNLLNSMHENIYLVTVLLYNNNVSMKYLWYERTMICTGIWVMAWNDRLELQYGDKKMGKWVKEKQTIIDLLVITSIISVIILMVYYQKSIYPFGK